MDVGAANSTFHAHQTHTHKTHTRAARRSLLPVDALVDAVEKRNRLKLLTPFLEHLIREGSTDPHVVRLGGGRGGVCKPSPAC